MDDSENQLFVSIVIPTRNEAEDIAETINSCFALDYKNKEIIVVDDSSDNTVEII
jgi:glycosyltransferase involved in cell wall biosynthesis